MHNGYNTIASSDLSRYLITPTCVLLLDAARKARHSQPTVYSLKGKPPMLKKYDPREEE